jgi:hypothetical protein
MIAGAARLTWASIYSRGELEAVDVFMRQAVAFDECEPIAVNFVSVVPFSIALVQAAVRSAFALVEGSRVAILIVDRVAEVGSLEVVTKASVLFGGTTNESDFRRGAQRFLYCVQANEVGAAGLWIEFDAAGLLVCRDEEDVGSREYVEHLRLASAYDGNAAAIRLEHGED